MKTIMFLKKLTFIEICLNILLVFAFNISFFLGQRDLTYVFFGVIALMHVLSMIMHWFAWKQLATTHKERTFFNVWVVGTFLIVYIAKSMNSEMIPTMLHFLYFFAFAWFFFYCYILFKEYKFLKRKKELYDQRELIHF